MRAAQLTQITSVHDSLGRMAQPGSVGFRSRSRFKSNLPNRRNRLVEGRRMTGWSSRDCNRKLLNPAQPQTTSRGSIGPRTQRIHCSSAGTLGIPKTPWRRDEKRSERRVSHDCFYFVCVRNPLKKHTTVIPESFS